MKTKLKLNVSPVKFSVLLGVFLLLCGGIRLRAADGTWTNDFDSIWSDATNWLNAVVADGSGSTVTFSNELGSPVVVNVDSPRTVGNMLFVQGGYTLTNNGLDSANILTLAGPSKPVINVSAALVTPPTIRRIVMAGTDGFVLDGGSQLNLFKENSDSNNVITGTVVFSNGTIQVQGITVGDNLANTRALNSVSSFTFYNGTLNLQPAVNTSPSYGNVNGNLFVPEGGVGTIVLPVRFTGSSGDNSAGIGSGLGGNLTGSGTFNVRSRYVRGNVVGDWSAFTGLLDIGPSSANTDNSFRFGNPAGFPNATVNFSGTTPLGIVYYRAVPVGNTNIRMGVLTGNNPLTTLTGSTTAGRTVFWEVGLKQTNAAETVTYAGTIANAAGPAGLITRGAGTLVLTGDSTYSGGTVISNGVLQVGDGSSPSGAIGSGPVTNHTILVFARSGDLVVPGAIHGVGSVTNNTPGGTVTVLGASTYSGPTTVSAGKLIMGTASRATGAYTIADAAGFGARMTSPNSTLVTTSVSFGTGCTYDFDLATFGNPSAAIVTNTGNIALNGNVTVNVRGTSSSLSLGTITLLEYGSRSGAGNFVLGTLPVNVTATLNDDTVNKRVTLTISFIFDPTLRYVGDVNGVWDIDNTANQIWKVVTSGLMTNYYDGAQVRFDDTATGTTTINVSTIVQPTSVTVDSSSLPYTFGGVGDISGVATLTKGGSSTLTIANLNDYSGLTRIDAGTLQFGDGVTDGAIGTGQITNNGTILLNNANAFTLANAISGAGNLIQAGAGAATISGNSSYSGGLTVLPGTSVALNNGNAAGIGGGINVISATVNLGADVAGNVGTIAIATNATFTATANRVINPAIVGTNVTVTFDKTALITLNGDISGVSGVITNMNTGLLRFNSGGGNACFGSTSVLFVLTEGSFLQNRNPGTIDLGNIEGAGTLGPPQNASGTVNFSIGALNTSTLFSGIINDNNTNANNRLTGITKVGAGTLTLSNALLTYFGPTVVSNGTVVLKGSSGISNSTSITVISPAVLDATGLDAGALYLGQIGLIQANRIQTLRGNGTILGSVVLGSNGRLEPGLAIGTLTVGSAQLGGTNLMEIDGPGNPLFDQLAASGSITYGGVLTVTNIGTLALTNGTHVFQLFNAPTITGLFSSVNLPPLPATKTWDTSELAAGRIKLVVNVNSTPTSITTAVSGSSLQLSWPADHIGWRLQVQTNSLSVGLSDNWVTVPNSDLSNSVTVPISPSAPAVFYRLVFP